MAFRSVATLSLSFGLVSIPVKVYSATESSAAIRFKLLARGGQRVRRQYVADEADTPMRQEEADDAVEPAAIPAPGAPSRGGAAAPVAAARLPAPARTPARAGAAASVEPAATATTGDRA